MERPATGPRILIVDDDAAIRGLLRVVAERSGVRSDEAANGAHARELLERSPYDLVLLDLAMPSVNGFDLIDSLGGRPRRPAVFVLTALERHDFARLDPDVVHCVIRKPFDLELVATLIVATATALYEQRVRQSRPPSLDQPEARP